MRVLEFTNQFSPEELAEALLAGGYPKWMTLEQVAGAKGPDDADCDITLDVKIDEDDALEAVDDSAILQAATEIRAGILDENFLEDAVRYVRVGENMLAQAMFARFLDASELDAVERALRH